MGSSLSTLGVLRSNPPALPPQFPGVLGLSTQLYLGWDLSAPALGFRVSWSSCERRRSGPPETSRGAGGAARGAVRVASGSRPARWCREPDLLGRAGKPKFRGGRGLAKGSTYGRRERCGDPRPCRPQVQLLREIWECCRFPPNARLGRWCPKPNVLCAPSSRVPSVHVISSVTVGWSAPTDKVCCPGGYKIASGLSQFN